MWPSSSKRSHAWASRFMPLKLPHEIIGCVLDQPGVTVGNLSGDTAFAPVESATHL
jgi:hypothetical protein